MNPSCAVTKLTDAHGRRPDGGVQVGAAGEPGGDLADAAVAAPEVARGVAEAPVPLRPGDAEPADAVALAGGVPRLGDELHPRQHRVDGDRGEQRGVRVERAGVRAAQHAREVDAEPVDAVHGHPVPHRVADQPDHRGRAGVEGVAAAGDVGVVAVAAQRVVGRRVEAAVAQRGAADAALRGVVGHDVEDHLDARGVQGRDHRGELGGLRARHAGVPGVRGEEAQRGVAPVVGHAALHERRLVGDRGDGQQLDRGDADLAEVLDHGRVRHAEVGAALLGGHLGVQLRPAAHVRLEDHRLRPRHVRPRVGGELVGRGDHRQRHVPERVDGAVDAESSGRPPTRGPPRGRSRARRSAGRTGRRGSSPGWPARPSTAGRARAPGSRSAGPRRCRGRGRATRRTSAP